MTAALIAAVFTPAARADTKSDLDAAIERVHSLESAAEAAYQDYSQAEDALAAVQQELAALTEQHAAQTAAVEASRRTLGRVARASYIAGGADPTMYLLLADDGGTFADSVGDLHRIANTVSVALERNRELEQQLADTQHQIADQEVAARQLRDQARQASEDSRRYLAEAQSVQNVLEEQYAAELAEQRRRAREEAAAQAAAARLEAAAREAAAAEAARLRPPPEQSAGSAPAAAAPPREAPQAAAAPVTIASSGGGRDQVVSYAMAQVGDRYVFGAKGPDAFDCSGLVAAAYRAAGMSVPSYTGALAKIATPVPLAQAEPGDLLFYFGKGAQHVGIYLGAGRMVHAANPRTGVLVSSLSESWYDQRFTMAGRLL